MIRLTRWSTSMVLVSIASSVFVALLTCVMVVTGSDVPDARRLLLAESTIVQPTTHETSHEPNVSMKAVPRTSSSVVSDERAFSVLLRLMMNRDRKSGDAYVRYIGLDAAPTTCAYDAAAKNETECFNALIGEYKRRIAAIDAQAHELRRPYGMALQTRQPIPEAVWQQLQQLQAEKEQLVNELLHSLPARLGKSSAEKISEFMNLRMKPHIEIRETYRPSRTKITH